MVDEIKIQIPVFDGKDYECWRKRITMILKMKKCEKVITRRCSEQDNRDTWNADDLKAINVIYSGISNNQLQFVKDLETAFEIIKRFDEMYIKTSTALQICVRNKLEKLKLKDFDDTTTFFSEFEKLTNELKSAGATVCEKEKLSYMIKMLPSSLSYVGDLVDVLKKSDQTVEYIKSKIKMLEVKEKEESTKTNTSVFKTERKPNQTCFKCGKYGHYKAQCMSTRPNGGNSWQPRGNLQQRGGVRQSNWQYRGSYHSRGSYNSGRGRGWQHTSGNIRNNEFNEDSNMNLSSFSTEVEVNPDLCQVNVKNCFGNVEWLLDSGCSDHIVNNDEYFYECTTLKTPVSVKIADGRMLKATKIGNIIHDFEVYGEKVRNKMSNVYFCSRDGPKLNKFRENND